MATVGKALRLLDCFSPLQGELGLSDFARAAGYDKATTHRHLNELAGYGLVQQDAETRAYRLGPALARLAALRDQTQPREHLARPMVEALARKTGETAHLSLFDGQRLVTALVAQGVTYSNRVVLDLGEVLPFHATASGLAVLATLSVARRRTLLVPGLALFTAATERDTDRLNRRLSEIGPGGVAQSVGGYEEDVHGTAVALVGPAGEVAGAIAVAAPVSRMTPAHVALIRRALHVAAKDITETWGGVLPPLPEPEPTS